jgi:sugar lactone lactonase YvrE
MYKELTTVLSGLAFPESLRWHNDELWFADVLAGKVYRSRVHLGQFFEVAAIQPTVGGLGWLPSGDLIVVDCDARKVILINNDGAQSTYVDMSQTWQYPANDMFVEKDGTIWIGSYGFDPETDSPRVSSLARYRSGKLDFPVGNLIFPNGIARIDEKLLVVSETFADRLAILETLPTGEVVIKKRIELPPHATPDGLTVDENGHVWVASAYGQAVLKVDPISNRVERAVEIQGRGVFDCTFGGPELETLFIATSDVDESKALKEYPGQVLAISVGVRGRG